MHDLSILQIVAWGIFALIIALVIFQLFVRLGCRTWLRVKRDFERDSFTKE